MKSKKVLTILLSMAIMLTFMPTFAFAADSVYVDPDDHEFTVLDKAASQAATHDAYGVEVWKCEGAEVFQDGDKVAEVGCNASKSYLDAPTNHDMENVKLSKEDLLKAWIAQEHPTEIQIARATEYATYACYGYVKKCAECGVYDFDTMEFEDHILPAKTPDCQEEYECKECHETITRTDIDDATEVGAEVGPVYYEPDNHDWVEVGTDYVCGNGSIPGEPTGYPVTNYKCSKCEAENAVRTSWDPVGGTAVHTGLPAPAYTAAQYAALDATQKAEVAKYHVLYNGDYYEPNDFRSNRQAPTCTRDSANDYGQLRCKVCGSRVGNRCTVKALGHKTITVTVPATCDEDGYTQTVCTVCGGITAKNSGAKATGHKYKVTRFAEPSIYDDGIVLIECENCHKIATNRMNDVDADYPWDKDWGDDPETEPVEETIPATVVNSKANGTGDWYFIGFNYEFINGGEDYDASKPAITKDAIKIDDWAALTPSWGAYEDFQAATCTAPLLQAKKDSVSGDYDVHSLRVIGKALGHIYTDAQTVEPTCGTYGYSYCVCPRCNEFVYPEGAVPAQIDVDVDGDGSGDDVYDAVDPVVKKGEPCDLKWVRKGDVMQLKCTVCGYVDTEVPYEDDTEREAAVEAAAPVIADANAKLAGNLTDDSAKAIKDAKTALENAMLYGESAKSIEEKTAALKAAVDGAKTKAANKMAASAKKIKASKKKTKKFSAAKAFTVSGNAGAVTYAKASGNKKITVAADGTVKVKKGLKKGKTYKVKVNVTDAGNGTTMGATQQVVLKVKIKK